MTDKKYKWHKVADSLSEIEFAANNIAVVDLDENVKKEILEDLHERWERETDGKVVFISAIEKRNLELLRNTILDKVREVYKLRYPYKTGFYPLSP